MSERMSYVPAFHAEGHDPGCGAHYLEPCDCASGIVRAVSLAFSRDLQRLLAQPSPSKDSPPNG